jgi:hypothetical protein
LHYSCRGMLGRAQMQVNVGAVDEFSPRTYSG